MTDVKKAVEEEIKATSTSIEKADTQISADSQIGLSFLDIEEVDYDAKWNIRRNDKYAERVIRKVTELMADGYIKTPLTAALMRGAPEGTKPRGIAGFVRIRALKYIRERYPEFFEDHFAGKVPFRIIVDIDEPTRQRLMMDHGSEEQLDEFELLEAVGKYLRQGLSESAIAAILSPLFYQLAGLAEKKKYNDRLLELRDKGFVMSGTTKITTLQHMQLVTWRGRLQFYKRIVTAPSAAKEEFRKYVDGADDAVKKGWFAIAEHLQACKTNEDVYQYFDEIRSAQRTGDKAPSARIWGIQKLKAAKAVCKSEYLGKQLDAALGDEIAAEQLLQLEDELQLIETAKKLNPDLFWDTVNGIVASAPQPQEEEIEETE